MRIPLFVIGVDAVDVCGELDRGIGEVVPGSRDLRIDGVERAIDLGYAQVGDTPIQLRMGFIPAPGLCKTGGCQKE